MTSVQGAMGDFSRDLGYRELKLEPHFHALGGLYNGFASKGVYTAFFDKILYPGDQIDPDDEDSDTRDPQERLDEIEEYVNWYLDEDFSLEEGRINPSIVLGLSLIDNINVLISSNERIHTDQSYCERFLAQRKRVIFCIINMAIAHTQGSLSGQEAQRLVRLSDGNIINWQDFPNNNGFSREITELVFGYVGFEATYERFWEIEAANHGEGISANEVYSLAARTLLDQCLPIAGSH